MQTSKVLRDMNEIPMVEKFVFETDDIGELQEAGVEWDQQYFQMSAGQFAGRMEMVQVDDTQIFREKWTQKIQYQGAAPEGSFAFALPIVHPEDGFWLGQSVDRNTVIAQTPGTEAEFLSPDEWETLALSLPEDRTKRLVSTLSDSGDAATLFQGSIKLTNDCAARLRALGTGFLETSKHLQTQNQRQMVAKYSEQFTKLFVWELAQAFERDRLKTNTTNPALVVKRATELAMSDQIASVGLTDICAHLNVSLRTLHYSFKEVTGVGPAAWLRYLRLNSVREELRNSTPDDVLIKQVALKHGFFHLGHFCNQYQQLFGYLPSQSLRAN